MNCYHTHAIEIEPGTRLCKKPYHIQEIDDAQHQTRIDTSVHHPNPSYITATRHLYQSRKVRDISFP